MPITPNDPRLQDTRLAALYKTKLEPGGLIADDTLRAIAALQKKMALKRQMRRVRELTP